MNHASNGSFIPACLVTVCFTSLLLQASATGLSTTAPTDSWAVPVRLKALAVDLLNPAPGAIPSPSTPSDLVQITIERWSTNEEAAKIASAVRVGEEDLVRVLDSFKPRVGYVRYLRGDDSMPAEDQQFSLAYAVHSVAQDGHTRIIIATAKRRYPNERESPIKVIEMRFGADGVGEGRIAAATVITTAGQPTLQLSNYTSARRCLKMVHKD
jgi:hypothetical protein